MRVLLLLAHSFTHSLTHPLSCAHTHTHTQEDGEPIRFKVGEGVAPAGFEAAVRAKTLGARGKVRLTSAEAFGEPREDLKRKIPMVSTAAGVVVESLVLSLSSAMTLFSEPGPRACRPTHQTFTWATE